MPYREFCQNKYNEIYHNKYEEELRGRTAASAQKASELAAQRYAINETFKAALSNYSPEYEVALLWQAIYVAHLKRKAAIDDLNTLNEEIISKVISAAQSWKKASGHVYESFIADVANPSLQNHGIKFVLQKELTLMIKKGEINNDDVDMDWINQRIHTDVFDLYAILTWQEQNYVFGCIQSKTSIRDRVTRDREPSQQAMAASFWSIAVALDGAFLAMPKFKEMVNGGGNDYVENGWHGLYVMSEQYVNDRIYSVDKNLTLLVEHARRASESFMRARQRFDHAWRP